MSSLPVPVSPSKQDCRIARGHGFNQLKDVPQGRALANNALEVHLAADFFFQIKFFLRQPVLQVRDFAVGECVVDSDGDLVRDLREEFDLIRTKGIFLSPRHRQDSEQAALADKRHVAK